MHCPALRWAAVTDHLDTGSGLLFGTVVCADPFGLGLLFELAFDVVYLRLHLRTSV